MATKYKYLLGEINQTSLAPAYWAYCNIQVTFLTRKEEK